MDDFISLRFTGNGVAPSNTRCRDVAALVKAVEQLVGALTESQDEDDDIPDDNPVYVLSIEDASLGFKFLAGYMAIALAGWDDLASVLRSNRIDLLEPKIRQPLEEIVSFVKRKNCNLELSDSRHNSVMAEITPAIQFPEAYKLRSKTTILGEVVRVGGSDPKVGLRLANGKVVSCETTEDVAKELGHRLYELVSCRGYAVWDVASNNILKFRIHSVKPFRQSKASVVFSTLAMAIPETIERWRAEGMQSTPLEE